MKLIFLGAPGAGKGTQSQYIIEAYGIPQISTGDILREARRNQTELGKKAETFMKAGELVPDDVMIGIVDERLQQSDCEAGFILDGFPRTVAQADALGNLLDQRQKKLDFVLNLEVPEEELVRRLSGRRTCQDCGASYHVEFSPTTTEGVCDKCQGQVIQRQDDQEDTVRQRLKVYHEKTHPLVDYYKDRGLLVAIDGQGSVDEISRQIQEVLRKAKSA